MKIVIQRVKKASCTVDKKILSQINKGYMILVGFTHQDTVDNVNKMAHKVANLRIFSDEFGKMNLNIKQVGGSILSISQFTLYANAEKGNRPSFVDSMNPDFAIKLYNSFNECLNNEYNIETLPGIFGADMQLDIICDGPVTIEMENK